MPGCVPLSPGKLGTSASYAFVSQNFPSLCAVTIPPEHYATTLPPLPLGTSLATSIFACSPSDLATPPPLPLPPLPLMSAPRKVLPVSPLSCSLFSSSLFSSPHSLKCFAASLPSPATDSFLRCYIVVAVRIAIPLPLALPVPSLECLPLSSPIIHLIAAMTCGCGQNTGTIVLCIAKGPQRRHQASPKTRCEGATNAQWRHAQGDDICSDRYQRLPGG